MTTPDRRILPAAQAVLIDRTGRATQPFYDFLRRLIDVTQLTPELIAELEELIELINGGAFLPNTANVVGAQSVHSQGTLAAGLVTLNLVNDTSLQQGTWYYGSNATEQKGWHRFFTALAAGAGIQIRNSGFIELGELDNAADLPPVGNSGEAYWVRGIFIPGEMGLWFWNGAAWELDPNASGMVGFNIANGDYGDITVAGDGATWTIDDDAVTYAKLQDVSAASRLLGRGDSGAGNIQEITLGTGLSMTGTTLNASGGGGGSLESSILADTPIAFWKCDETTGTTLADSSGNGRDLTLTGTFTLAYSAMIPSVPAEKFVRFGTGSSSYASRSGDAGLTLPPTGDYTLEAIVLPTFGGNRQTLLQALGPSHAVEADNFQYSLVLNASNIPEAFWEHGSGTNVQTISAIPPLDRTRVIHYMQVKDGTANTVTFYINGIKMSVDSYGDEPTGGGNANTYLGGNPVDGGFNGMIGYVAIYSAKLSDARIVAHAAAAGLLG